MAIGEIRIFAGDWEPKGWAFCNGALLNIADHRPLYDAIGTSFGGDGTRTFALPNLGPGIPVDTGNGFDFGSAGTAPLHAAVPSFPLAYIIALVDEDFPPYVGEVRTFGFSIDPVGWKRCDGQVLTVPDALWLAQVIGNKFGGDGQSTLALPDLRTTDPSAVPEGQSPEGQTIGYLVMNFCIALQGTFPYR